MLAMSPKCQDLALEEILLVCGSSGVPSPGQIGKLKRVSINLPIKYFVLWVESLGFMKFSAKQDPQRDAATEPPNCGDRPYVEYPRL